MNHKSTYTVQRCADIDIPMYGLKSGDLSSCGLHLNLMTLNKIKI